MAARTFSSLSDYMTNILLASLSINYIKLCPEYEQDCCFNTFSFLFSRGKQEMVKRFESIIDYKMESDFQTNS